MPLIILISKSWITDPPGVPKANRQVVPFSENPKIKLLNLLSLLLAKIIFSLLITVDNLQRFHELARIGSSTLTSATAQECIDHDECERAIVALTPEDLKTALTAKIRQIIADRLAFTAPSITATIEEGGSLYQAQFSYEQFGEWQGTILRKGIDAKGEVTHLITDPGNWSAAAQIKGQSTRGSTADTRYIWSAIPGVPFGCALDANCEPVSV